MRCCDNRTVRFRFQLILLVWIYVFVFHNFKVRNQFVQFVNHARTPAPVVIRLAAQQARQ